MKNLSNEFIWWQGVVEDRNDPLMLGRCRVRILGYHTEDKNDIPTESLPWAYQAMPINTRPNSVPVGPTEGTWVMGFFRDGSDCQEPIVTHVIDYGIQSENDPRLGFNDPETNTDKPVGKVEIDVGEVNTNRLARGITTDTLVEKNENRDEYSKGVATAHSGKSWREPQTEGLVAPKYPYNYVEESESGHVFEVDDTPGKERLSKRHKSGTFEEIHNDGVMMTKVVNDNYEVILGDDNIHVTGSVNITSDSRVNIKSTETINVQSDNQIRFSAGSHIILDAVGAIQVNGTYLSTTKGTPIMHGGQSTMVTPVGIPLFPDNQIRTKAARTAAKMNMGIQMMKNMTALRTQGLGPVAIQKMISSYVGFNIPLTMEDIDLRFLMTILPDTGFGLPIQDLLQDVERIQSLAKRNINELTRNITMGIVMGTGGMWAERIANTFGAGLDFMKTVDWEGLKYVIEGNTSIDVDEIYLHILKVGNSSIFKTTVLKGAYVIGESVYIWEVPAEVLVGSEGVDIAAAGEKVKRIVGEVLESSQNHVTILPDGDTFDLNNNNHSKDAIFLMHEQYEGMDLIGSSSEATSRISDTVRANGHVIDETILDSLVATSTHIVEEPVDEYQWIYAIKTEGDLWNAVAETHGLYLIDFYKENLTSKDITSEEQHPIYKPHDVKWGIIPRIGSTAFGGISTKEKLFHEMHVLMGIIPEGFTADNASDSSTSDGMIIRAVSPYKPLLFDYYKGMQKYKLYLEGIPLRSKIKIFEFKGIRDSNKDLLTLTDVGQKAEGVPQEFINTPRYPYDDSFDDYSEFDKLRLSNMLKTGSSPFKWGGAKIVDPSKKINTVYTIEDYIGEMVFEHIRMDNTYPYQLNMGDVWVWDGTLPYGQRNQYHWIPKRSLPYIFVIESTSQVMQDSSGQLVCYENTDKSEEIISKVFGVFWVARGSDTEDDLDFQGGHELPKKIVTESNIEQLTRVPQYMRDDKDEDLVPGSEY